MKMETRIFEWSTEKGANIKIEVNPVPGESRYNPTVLGLWINDKSVTVNGVKTCYHTSVNGAVLMLTEDSKRDCEKILNKQFANDVFIDTSKEYKHFYENEFKAYAENREEFEQFIEKAKEENKPQIIKKWSEACNDPDEECSLDFITLTAYPDGSIKANRQHTW